jgi:flagellar protein FliO/FliZ
LGRPGGRRIVNGAGFTTAMWFIAVIAAIPLVLWLVKRTPLGGGGFGGPGLPRLVGVTALSPQQRLVTVEVGQGESRQWLVLGVTPHGIRTLHTMAPQAPEVPAGPPAQAAAFSQLMGRLRDKD